MFVITNYSRLIIIMNKTNNYSFLIAISQNVINKSFNLKINCEMRTQVYIPFHK